MVSRKEQAKRTEQEYQESQRKSLFPILPPIPAAYIDWSGIEWRKNEDDGGRTRYHWYTGPIEVGMIFAWEPDLPHAQELLIVVKIDEETVRAEKQIWTMPLDSPYRGKPWTPHVAPQLFEGKPLPQDEGRFREAIVTTYFKPQTP